MRATKFRVENFRNIEDSGWIPLDDVTAFVGRNEAGKTALLKALHLFNPATPERHNPKQDYPRDRYARDWPSPDHQMDLPVCHVEFAINEDLQSRISSLLLADEDPPTQVIVTRRYDHSLSFQYAPNLRGDIISSEPVTMALKSLAASARRYRQPRRELAEWATDTRSQLMRDEEDMQHDTFTDAIRVLHNEANNYADDVTMDAIERFQQKLDTLIRRNDALEQVSDLLEQEMPVFIYFENYGVLDSAVWLPRFVEDLHRTPHDPRIRTLSAMFKHANLDPHLIAELDVQPSIDSPDDLTEDQRNKKEERAIRLNSASNEISRKFSSWWKQRRHKIRYHADGGYFRIYVADETKDVEIELEARSKGFQWFFSFYLVFLVESEDQHKNAILLLDEPGLHLHPTAQQELIEFFGELAKSSQLAYTTHSPFLIDGDNLHRIRPVVEKESGNAVVSIGHWPADRETMFPVEAAAGYAIMRGLFRHQENLLVEGITDYHYLHALSRECARLGRTVLPDGVVVTPCGGASKMSYLASLFVSHDARPVILLDDDETGRNRSQELLRNLFADHASDVLVLGDVLGIGDKDVEMEDIVGEQLILRGLREAVDIVIEITEEDRTESESTKKRSLLQTIGAAVGRSDTQLPTGWKLSVATWIVSALARGDVVIDDLTADRADRLFSAIRNRLG